MLKRVLATLFIAAGVTAVAAPAMAAGPVTICYSASVVVNGAPVVAQGDCQPK